MQPKCLSDFPTEVRFTAKNTKGVYASTTFLVKYLDICLFLARVAYPLAIERI